MRGMASHQNLSRRQFIATSAVALAASQLPGAESAQDKLALDGGEKAVALKTPTARRWGEPELQQLGEAVKQDSLYYWKNKQTTLLTERLQKRTWQRITSSSGRWICCGHWI